MKLEIIERVPWQELEQKVRQVPLLKARKSDGGQIFVYEKADISLISVSPEEVNPTSFYAVIDGLQKQRDLRNHLLDRHGIDTLELTELLRLRTEDGQEFGLMPPVVEVQRRRVRYVPAEGELSHEGTFEINIPLINDGLHRFMIARELGSRVNVIYVVGADPEFPFYAHPNSWNDVKVVDSVPKTAAEKKAYLRVDSNLLYRDFGVFGCGAPRGTGK